MEKVPYMLVLGDKEVEAGQVAVRRRDGEQSVVSADEFIATVANRIIEFTPDGIIDRNDNYDEYLQWKKENQK